MSLDIHITNKNGERIAEINWLRNPFGLCQWAEDNVGTDVRRSTTLHYVCNHWNYGQSKWIDRRLFADVVYSYWEKIDRLKQGYFCFGLPEYIQFVQPQYRCLPIETSAFGFSHIQGQKYAPDDRLMIPMEHFGKEFDLGIDGLEGYKKWYRELIDIVDMLQDESNSFYCSN